MHLNYLTYPAHHITTLPDRYITHVSRDSALQRRHGMQPREAQQHSPRASKRHASEVNAYGEVVDEDTSTIPIGNRFLQSTFASKAYQPRHSSFVSTDFNPDKVYYARHVVASDEHSPPPTAYDHIVWALENECFEPQILKMAILAEQKHIAPSLKNVPSDDRVNETYRRVWLLFELWTEVIVDIPDLSDSAEPILFLDPQVYVTGPCWKMSARQRYVLYFRANVLGSLIISLGVLNSILSRDDLY